MDNIAVASINSFGSTPKANVPQSEESIFVLSGSELKAIIAKAIQEATKPILTRLSDLEGTLRTQEEEIVDLRAFGEAEIERVCVDIATDRRRLAALEHPTKEPGKTETSRAEKIEKYLASRPDHKATFETLKGMLQVDNIRLNEAIKVLIAASDHSYVIQKEKTGDKRKRSLIMLPK